MNIPTPEDDIDKDGDDKWWWQPIYITKNGDFCEAQNLIFWECSFNSSVFVWNEAKHLLKHLGIENFNWVCFQICLTFFKYDLIPLKKFHRRIVFYKCITYLCKCISTFIIWASTNITCCVSRKKSIPPTWEAPPSNKDADSNGILPNTVSPWWPIVLDFPPYFSLRLRNPLILHFGHWLFSPDHVQYSEINTSKYHICWAYMSCVTKCITYSNIFVAI